MRNYSIDVMLLLVGVYREESKYGSSRINGQTDSAHSSGVSVQKHSRRILCVACIGALEDTGVGSRFAEGRPRKHAVSQRVLLSYAERERERE